MLTGPVLDKEMAARVSACEAGTEAEVRESLVGSFRELATVESTVLFAGFSPDNFVLEPGGVHFFGSGYEQRWGAAIGMGPTVPYDVLLRDGYLKKGSPVARAWEGVAPAPKGKPPCPPGVTYMR